MGNGVAKLNGCCPRPGGEISRRHDIAVILPFNDGLGHSFCYIPHDPARPLEAETAALYKTTSFPSISGASVSANASTALSTAPIDFSSALDRASTFESSDCFASLPLQPIPRDLFKSGSGNLTGSGSGERGFLSGPIERRIQSGPIDAVSYSGPVFKEKDTKKLTTELSNIRTVTKPTSSKKKNKTFMEIINKILSGTIFRSPKSSVEPINGSAQVKSLGSEKTNESVTNFSSTSHLSTEENDNVSSMESQNLQWAQGKAGEDRVHLVISEEHEWVFIGIYDGFNGPDAPDYLLNNLYSFVHKELKGLLWNEELESLKNSKNPDENLIQLAVNDDKKNDDFESKGSSKHGNNTKNNREENQRRWKCELDQLNIKRSNESSFINHFDVLKALSTALKKTEDGYLDIADKTVDENPELALMGSCVLVMLMKGEDVYLMNVGDSRAVLAKKPEAKGRVKQDSEQIKEESIDHNLQGFELNGFADLVSIQLTKEHSTYVAEEIRRIKREHPDDENAIYNDRVKGYLKVTRAFGAGFLKQPKWNDALLEMFRIDYIGTSPYLTCSPSLHHHRLNQRDKFLILSSDGLYQYFSNEEAVFEVASFIAACPEGDPAQHLIEEVLFRAAKKYGMDFHELLEIPQGDRRRYHDDVSVIVISFEGRIWRSSM